MHLGSQKDAYNTGQTILITVTAEKHKFHKHVLAALSKATQILAIVKRNFDTLEKEVILLR